MTHVMSDNITEIASALAKVQAKLEPASKDKDNPFLKSKYASLDSIWSTCRKLLTDNGLSVAQMPTTMDGQLALTTVLMHGKSGQFIRSTFEIQPTKADPQGVGSALTYARRYALSALVGITVDDDDDGHAASQTTKQQPARQPAKKAAPPPNGFTPVFILDMLNEAPDTKGYYKDEAQLFETMIHITQNDSYAWPAKDNKKAWQDVFKDIRNHVMAQKQATAK